MQIWKRHQPGLTTGKTKCGREMPSETHQRLSFEKGMPFCKSCGVPRPRRTVEETMADRIPPVYVPINVKGAWLKDSGSSMETMNDIISKGRFIMETPEIDKTLSNDTIEAIECGYIHLGVDHGAAPAKGTSPEERAWHVAMQEFSKKELESLFVIHRAELTKESK